MARAERPASESYQSVCCSVGQSLSYSSTAAIEKVEDEGDHLPIFSLSKSSMDVVMATGPPHKRDPAWTGIDLRRSSSTNTHTEQIQYTLQQQHPEGRQQAGGLQSSLAYQNPGAPSPTGLNERWITNMPRWSRCSSSTHSRSSTPDTIVWRGGSSRPCSLTQELQCSSAPDSPMSKLASPPTTPSPFISPLMTPTLALQDPLALSTHQQDASATASASPPTPSQQAKPASPAPADCNDLLLPSSTEDEAFLENNMLSFQFPSPVPSSVSLQKAASPDPGCFLNSFIDGLTSVEGAQSPKLEELTSPEQLYGGNMPNSVAEEQESDREAFACLLELPWQPVQTCSDGQSCRPHLISSLSDSRLGESCRCNCSHREATTKVDISRKEGNMTTQRDVADASVQTMSPVGSWWDLRRNTSNMGSHSILGSPPGSRLNLKSSVGSNSNLVSPSSSMFPMSDGEDGETQADDPRWDINSASSHDLDRRRSCLKIQGEEREELGRRSSMKQVQWDEDGMTWDVHGASVDPVVLSTAIQKHLELQNGPKPPQQSSKKKKAPQPPILSNVVKAIVTKPETPVMITTSMYTADCVNKASPEEDRQREVEEEAGGKTEEPADAAPETTGAKGSNTKEAEDEEVCGEEGTSYSKSPSRGSAISRKKSVIRSLRRPGWCVSSRKADD